MLTAGVDLAAEPRGTALAVIEWGAGRATLIELYLGVDDPQIVEATNRVAKSGIGCAFGWPVEFVEFVATHSGGRGRHQRRHGLAPHTLVPRDRPRRA